MTDPSIDLERLAALLDGKLTAAERDRLLAEIADSPEALDLLADTAATQRELERGDDVGDEGDLRIAAAFDALRQRTGRTRPEGSVDKAPWEATPWPETPETGPPSVPPTPDALLELVGVGAGSEEQWPARFRFIPPRRRWPLRRWAFLVAAAAAVAAVALRTWMSRAAGERAIGDPAAVIALIEAPPSPGGNVLDEVPWPATRGANETLTARGRAVRFGAHTAELLLAVRAADTTRARLLAARAAAVIGDVAGSGPAVRLLEQARDAPGASTATVASLLDQAWSAGAAVAGPEDASLGAWLAAARVAAARGDSAFFRAPPARPAAAALAVRLAERPDLDPAVRAAGQRVRDTIAGTAPVASPSLVADLTTVLAALGG